MADEKDTEGNAKDTKAKPKAAKKPAAKKASAKSSAGKGEPKKAAAAKSKSTKAGAKKSAAKKRAARPSVGLDKSLAQLRESLEHSVTLSRDRIQEVVDDAVKRGRMTHGDAEKMIGELLKRGRKQTDALLSELEKLVRQARRKLP
ncbi:MAG: hypothetical protein JSU06_06260 [Actinobacteria bacterium]|nr:hypothetical protein [Actinomycetota bacterium]